MSQPEKKNGNPASSSTPPIAATIVPQTQQASQPATIVKQSISLASLLDSPAYRSRFEEMLGKKAAGFISSILALQNVNLQLKTIAQKNPRSIITAAAIAATLDLPINPNLGFAHIVPYGDAAQFQMGWRGYVQLAIRTGLYKTISATEIYEGEIVSYNRLSGESVIDEAKRKSDTVVGYMAYYRLTSGFEKSLYMTVDQVRRHGQRYSKSFHKAGTPWQVNFDAMALKTVVKLLLNKWGLLSIEMQKAIQYDQVVVKETERGGEVIDYVDNDTNKDASLVNEDGEPTEEAIAAAIPKVATQVSATELFGDKK